MTDSLRTGLRDLHANTTGTTFVCTAYMRMLIEGIMAKVQRDQKLILCDHLWMTNHPSEFHITGHIKDWDISESLERISVPTLVIGARYEEVTPAVTRAVYEGTSDAKWTFFEHSSHLPHL